MLDGGEHWHHLVNATEPSVCGGDAAFYQITLTTCVLLSSGEIQFVSDRYKSVVVPYFPVCKPRLFSKISR